MIIIIIIVMFIFFIYFNNTSKEYFEVDKIKKSSIINHSFDLRHLNPIYENRIYAPLEYNYGYSDADNPIFSAHPNKLVNIKELVAMKTC